MPTWLELAYIAWFAFTVDYAPVKYLPTDSTTTIFIEFNMEVDSASVVDPTHWSVKNISANKNLSIVNIGFITRYEDMSPPFPLLAIIIDKQPMQCQDLHQQYEVIASNIKTREGILINPLFTRSAFSIQFHQNVPIFIYQPPKPTISIQRK